MKPYRNSNQINVPGNASRVFTRNSFPVHFRLWHKLATFGACLFALVVLAGCASTKVSNRQQLVTGPLPKPGQIWVYDYVASAADLPADSIMAGEPDLDTTSQTEQDIAEGKKLGKEIATELVAEIKKMGMPAAVATAATKPKVNDLVIRGYLLSIKEGSGVKRVIIGFGAGASELRTVTEGFQMTSTGLRKLGSGTVQAGGNKSPGMVLGVATFLATKNPVGLIINGGLQGYQMASGSSSVTGRAKSTAKEIADVLKQRFTDQGWIN